MRSLACMLPLWCPSSMLCLSCAAFPGSHLCSNLVPMARPCRLDPAAWRPRDSPLQVVSLHCALVPATKHLINKERLSHMKKDALLINASRGPVVNETDLVAHLKANPNFRC